MTLRTKKSIKTPWKKVVAVFPQGGFSLRLEWEDGECSIVELNDLIEKRDFLWRLRNPLYFSKASVDPLGAVCWPEGEDISPKYLEAFTRAV